MPLLNFWKMSAQASPSRAKRLATTLRTHSSTQSLGCTYFHSTGFLLPMVVSSATWGRAGGRCTQGPEGPPDSQPGRAATQGAVLHQSWSARQLFSFWKPRVLVWGHVPHRLPEGLPDHASSFVPESSPQRSPRAAPMDPFSRLSRSVLAQRDTTRLYTSRAVPQGRAGGRMLRARYTPPSQRTPMAFLGDTGQDC